MEKYQLKKLELVIVCVLPWAVAPQGCSLAWLWCWTPRLTGHLADPEAFPAPSADPQSPADAQAEPWTPKQTQSVTYSGTEHSVSKLFTFLF